MTKKNTSAQEFFIYTYYAVGWYALAAVVSSTIILVKTRGLPTFTTASLAELTLSYAPLSLISISAFLMWRRSNAAPFITVLAAAFYSWISWTGLQAPEAGPDNAALQMSVLWTVILWFYAILGSFLLFRKPNSLDSNNDL